MFEGVLPGEAAVLPASISMPKTVADFVRGQPLGLAPGRCRRHGLLGVGRDQFLVVDAAEREEQLGLGVQPGPDPIEHGGDVLAHPGRVGATAVERHLAGQGKQPFLPVGHDLHHVVRESALEQFQERADLAAAPPLERRPLLGRQGLDRSP